jgi:hypothetical protein
MAECPYGGEECKRDKERIRSLEIAQATMRVEAINMAESADKIEKSVDRMGETFKQTTSDLYSKYGEVRQMIHTEETSRMKADKNIEDSIEVKGNGKASRNIAYAALIISAIGIILKVVF